jgi:hypothetical protein
MHRTLLRCCCFAHTPHCLSEHCPSISGVCLPFKTQLRSELLRVVVFSTAATQRYMQVGFFPLYSWISVLSPPLVHFFHCAVMVYLVSVSSGKSQIQPAQLWSCRASNDLYITWPKWVLSNPRGTEGRQRKLFSNSLCSWHRKAGLSLPMERSAFCVTVRSCTGVMRSEGHVAFQQSSTSALFESGPDSVQWNGFKLYLLLFRHSFGFQQYLGPFVLL